MPKPELPLGFPDKAAATLPKSAPHERQNLPVSGFCVPHFGQNIMFN
jgi:hypothetical protein